MPSLHSPSQVGQPRTYARQEDSVRLYVWTHIKFHTQKLLDVPQRLDRIHGQSTEVDLVDFAWAERCQQQCQTLPRTIGNTSSAHIDHLMRAPMTPW